MYNHLFGGYWFVSSLCKLDNSLTEWLNFCELHEAVMPKNPAVKTFFSRYSSASYQLGYSLSVYNLVGKMLNMKDCIELYKLMLQHDTGFFVFK